VPATEVSPLVRRLLDDLDNLPSDRSTVLRVAQLAGDDDISAAEVAEAAALDPAFAERLLRMANSAYFARATPATTIHAAVAVVGLRAVRSLALAAALAGPNDGVALPADFWRSAATIAVCSRRAAPHLGADEHEAFAAGLLCDVGQALLFRAGPAEYYRVAAADDLPAAELAWCGTTHGQISALALTAGRLPAQVVAAVAHHHGGAQDSPLATALQVGVLLAQVVAEGEVDDHVAARISEASSGRVPTATARSLALSAAGEAAAVLLGLP
jgi:HD-like signal output (HDOD) protein